jgi:hypothetical protein
MDFGVRKLEAYRACLSGCGKLIVPRLPTEEMVARADAATRPQSRASTQTT